MSENGILVTAKKASRYEPISVGKFVAQQFTESYTRAKEYEAQCEKSV